VESVQLKGVVKDFGKSRILDDVNITIKEGDLMGVIGQSGSGKTTLLNLISGFLRPSEGNVLFSSGPASHPLDLRKNLSKIKKQIGFTPQHNSFYPKLTVKENLVHFGKLYGIKKNTLESNIKGLLNITKLSDHVNKISDQLSGGMQKRLDIACSLIHKPKLLILDEPTADLDPVLQKEMLLFLKEINRKDVTIVIASHNLEGIEQICNKIAIIHKGKVKSFGNLEEVRKPFIKDHFTINLHSREDKDRLLDHIKNMPVEKIVDQGHSLIVYPNNPEMAINNIIRLIREENLSLHDLDLRKTSLNEVFEQITVD
jgi:ABC-2 type transport system ATP-binding protein